MTLNANAFPHLSNLSGGHQASSLSWTCAMPPQVPGSVQYYIVHDVSLSEIMRTGLASLDLEQGVT
jgi:hypothetical protein